MSRTRPSLIAGLGLTTPAPAPRQEPEPSPPAALAPTPKVSTSRKATPDMMHTSLYLPKVVHQKLREIAFATDRKVHDLLIEGVDEVLRRHGHAPVGTLKDKR